MNSEGTTKIGRPLTLFDVAEEGDAVAAARLLAAGTSADERRAPGGETPLMRAAARGHEEVARILLDAGADAGARRADGFTPLILAVFFGHEAVVGLLVERGADADASTSLGTTATRWAEARGFASMTKVLRGAAASRPRVLETGMAARAKAATKRTPDEVEIFSRRIGRRDVGGEVDEAGAAAPSSAAEEKGRPSNVTTTADSVRHRGQLPAAPPFRVGAFLRSWPGALGALLLLTALGVAVFALLDRNRAPSSAAQSAPTPTAPQATAQQTPAPPLPTPEPSPAFPTPDPHGIMPVPDQTYAVPNGAGQPYYVSPGPVSPVASDAPNDLSVVSESGAPAARDAGQSGRRANPNDSAPARNDNAAAAAPRTTRTPEPEPQRPAPPSPNQPPPSVQPTPRAKVIQWPPQ